MIKINKVILSGKLLPTYKLEKDCYEGLFEYNIAEIKTGNLIIKPHVIGIYIPVKVLEGKDISDYVSKNLEVEGSLVAAEIDSKTRTSVIVALKCNINLNEDTPKNEVILSGTASGSVTHNKGISYSLFNQETPMTTRVFTSLNTQIRDEDRVSIWGRLISYPYTSKLSGRTYNVSGVEIQDKMDEVKII